MKTIVSRPMAAALRSFCSDYSVSYHEISREEYSRRVDYDIFNHENDFLPKSGKMKVIKIEYPQDFYAMPTYITTNDLCKAGKDLKASGQALTLENYLRAVYRTIEL